MDSGVGTGVRVWPKPAPVASVLSIANKIAALMVFTGGDYCRASLWRQRLRNKVLLLARSAGFRHVVTSAGSGFKSLVRDINADSSEAAVHSGITRPVANLILRTQL